MSSSSTYFSIEYLDSCSTSIEVLGANFEGLTQCYNIKNQQSDENNLQHFSENFGRNSEKKFILREDRLEEAWILYRVTRKPQFQYPKELKLEYTDGNHVDIESICEQVLEVNMAFLLS